MTYNPIEDIPRIGLVFGRLKEIMLDTVYKAIKSGYRHLDSASDYGNEER